MDIGLVVDVETTGLNPEVDEIIEIGVLEFVAEGGDPPAITNIYGGLEQPSQPLKPEIVEITGLTDKVLRGRKIDWQLVRAMFERAELVVAHNAPFDRGFLSRRPELAGINCHWACSVQHINWAEKGYRSKSLNYLACDHGFLNPFAHRAVFDCATTFRLIAPHLEELTTRSFEREFLLEALGAPFEKKDILREQGYRWNRDKRVWAKTVVESELKVEREFLATSVYNGHLGHGETALDPH